MLTENFVVALVYPDLESVGRFCIRGSQGEELMGQRCRNLYTTVC